MTSKQFLPTSLLATILCFLVACNGNEEKTGTDTADSDTATTTTDTSATMAEPVATSTVTRTPQGMFMAKHRVANFSKWMASYEAHDSMRLANGLHSYVIGRGVQDTNMVLVVVKADDMAKAKAFSKDASLKKAMQAGGVIGAPTMQHLNATYQDTAVLSDAMRSLSVFNVKDWVNWQKGFEDGRSERIENGIADRVYGNDPENPNKVVVVTAAVDSAKATAYWKSDKLKQRREAGGVIGSPDRFLFRIVKRY
jgi:hypothetical protein